MSEELSNLVCEPCRKEGKTVVPTSSEIEKWQHKIPLWSIKNENNVSKLQRTFKFKNFRFALEFTNAIGALAEKEGHHPAILTEWGSVVITWWTHAINGLHKNDFIMAAKTDDLYMVDEK